MPATDVEICSMSLLKLGASPIASFDDETVEAELARSLYEPIVQALLVAHPWAFSLTVSGLVEAAEQPARGFRYAYLLPNGLLRTIAASGSTGRNSVYRVMGDRLFSDDKELSLTYQQRPETSLFPPHFVQALAAKLAAELCLPLTESSTRAEVLQRVANAEVKLARLVDSQQSTARAVEDYTLIGVRG